MFKEDPIRWKKRGLIILPDRRRSWSQTHCMVPTPFMLGHGLLRIFFSGRDSQNRSSIGSVILDLNQDGKIVENPPEPILTLGELGCFDDNGVTPSCVIRVKNKIHLYYIGWSLGGTTRMSLFGGLAISEDEGKTFNRWSRAPILERTIHDPLINTAPWVVQDKDDYRIYYVSGTEWVHKDLPRYLIKMGTSMDGLNWKREGKVCLDYKDPEENALARPYVIRESRVWKMWFAYKGEKYRIGYAESADGVSWERRDHWAGIGISDEGFDSEMIEYAAVVKYQGRSYMFYNGNNYGYEGIGWAVEE